MKKGIFVFLAFGLFLSAVPYSIQAQSYYMLSPFDFRPLQIDGYSPIYYYNYTSGPEAYLFNYNEDMEFAAPIHLPQGARITRIALNCMDYRDDANFTLRLFCKNSFSYQVYLLGEVVSTGKEWAWRWFFSTPMSAWINNSGYSYFLVLSLPYTLPNHEMFFGSVRISYY